MPEHAQQHAVVNCAKMAEPIRMPFGLWPQGGPKEACVTWGAHWRDVANTIESSMFGGPAKTAEPIEMPFGIWTRVCPSNHILDGVADRPCDGAILGERTYLGMPNDTLP